MILKTIQGEDVHVTVLADSLFISGEPAIIQMKDSTIRLDNPTITRTIMISGEQFLQILIEQGQATNQYIGLATAIAMKAKQDERILFQELAACNFPLHMEERNTCAWPTTNGYTCDKTTHFALWANDPRQANMQVIVPLCREHSRAFHEQYAAPNRPITEEFGAASISYPIREEG